MRLPLLATLVVALTSAVATGATPELVRRWETKPELKVPESVLFDAKGAVLYVSNIDGREPWKKDGAGSIAKVGLDGQVIAVEWVKGLNGPKGLGLHAGKLYAADIDAVAVIDVAKGAIVQSIAVPGAQGLNDITIDAAGVVYVSDSMTKKVHRIVDGKPTTWLEGLAGPNGLLAIGNVVYLLDDGVLYRVSGDAKREKIVDGIEGGVDGIECVEGDAFIVTGWQGKIYYVKGHEKTLLLDSAAKGVQSADIGYDAKNRIVYVPTFFTNTVVAYELKVAGSGTP